MTAVNEFLEHHGVRGMKWGVRQDKGHAGKRTKTKKIEKLDKKFAERTQSLDVMIKVNNAAAAKANEIDVPRINNKKEYRDQDFSRDSPLRQKYYKEHQDAFLDRLETAAKDLGTNASGTKEYGILEGSDGGWNVILKDVKHADPVLRVKVHKNPKGHVVKLEILPPLEHSQAVDDILEHYGVKGMRWGVKGGASKTPRKKSGDAKKVSELKKKKPSELTNKQLKTANERMNLEQNFRRLNPTKAKIGKEFVAGTLATLGLAVTAYNMATSPAGKAAIEAGKAVIKKGGLKTAI